MSEHRRAAVGHTCVWQPAPGHRMCGASATTDLIDGAIVRPYCPKHTPEKEPMPDPMPLAQAVAYEIALLNIKHAAVQLGAYAAKHGDTRDPGEVMGEVLDGLAADDPIYVAALRGYAEGYMRSAR